MVSLREGGARIYVFQCVAIARRRRVKGAGSVRVQVWVWRVPGLKIVRVACGVRVALRGGGVEDSGGFPRDSREQRQRVGFRNESHWGS